MPFTGQQKEKAQIATTQTLIIVLKARSVKVTSITVSCMYGGRLKLSQNFYLFFQMIVKSSSKADMLQLSSRILHPIIVLLDCIQRNLNSPIRVSDNILTAIILNKINDGGIWLQLAENIFITMELQLSLFYSFTTKDSFLKICCSVFLVLCCEKNFAD